MSDRRSPLVSDPGPTSGTPQEFEGVDRMRALLDRYAPQAHRLILLNRTVARASSTTEYRAALEAEGWHVARATVGRREQFAQSYGAIPFRASSTAFGDCLAEGLVRSRNHSDLTPLRGGDRRRLAARSVVALATAAARPFSPC